MTDLLYDSEFHEDGRTIDVISMAMINRDTGEELYLISADADWERIKRLDDPFLCREVIPHLPLARPVTFDPVSRTFDFAIDGTDPRVVTRTTMAQRFAAFILAAPRPRICTWIGPYDMIVLNQLWGRMSDKPAGIPWAPWELQQEVDRLGLTIDDLPSQPAGLHDALADARHLLTRIQWLEAYAAAAAVSPGVGADLVLPEEVSEKR